MSKTTKIEQAYKLACEQYAACGVDTVKVQIGFDIQLLAFIDRD